MDQQYSNEFYLNQQQFNPIETFGSRQNTASQYHQPRVAFSEENLLQSQKEKQEQIKKSRAQRGTNFDNREPYQKRHGQNSRDAKQQTRIKLLSSFQQSYLESISHPNFTEPDQSEIKIQYNKDNFLYSEPKQLKFYDKKMNQESHPYGNSELMKKSSKEGGMQKQRKKADMSENLRSHHMERRKSTKYLNEADLQRQIKSLQAQINEQEYNLSIEDKIYDFLVKKINERGKARKTKDIHLIIQKAVDFMDSGQQFIKQLSKLNSYIKN